MTRAYFYNFLKYQCYPLCLICHIIKKASFSARVSYVSIIRLADIIAVSRIFKKQLILTFSLAISIGSPTSYTLFFIFSYFNELFRILIPQLIILKFL